MKNKKFRFHLLLVITVLFIGSCVIKPMEAEGTVFSRHHIPVPNVIVMVGQYGSSNYPETSRNVITDQNGKYKVEWAVRSDRYYTAEVSCDSGSGRGHLFSKGGSKIVDINLK